MNYVSGLSITLLEEYLENLTPTLGVKLDGYGRESDRSSSALNKLSKERLELLTLLLRKSAP